MKNLFPAIELLLVLLACAQDRGAWGALNTLTGPNDCTPAGAYTLCQNLWGADTGVGSQTTTLISANGNSVSWETNYTWANSPDNVKSYPNVFHNTAKGMQLQDIVSVPTQWSWNYTMASSQLRADVSYDIWTGVPQSGDPASAASSYEIMIWLSSQGGIGGIGDVVASNVNIGGHQWNLKYGPNSNWEVFSFITAEGDINDFSGDLNEFFQYLINNKGVADTQFLQAVQTGTEAFTGSANLVTNNFSVDVSTQANSTSTSSTSSHGTRTSATLTATSSSFPPATSESSTISSVTVAQQTSAAASSSSGSSSSAGKCRLRASSTSGPSALKRSHKKRFSTFHH